MSRRTIATGAVVVAALGTGVTVAAMTSTARPAAPAPNATATPTTEPITRSDLVDTKQVSGTLGYGGRRVQPNRATGMVTGMRSEGTLVRRGGWLYRVNRRPVILFYGDVPLYRTLAIGVDGRDVKQLERNLKALGYHPGTVDEDFSGLTAQAVRSWQDDHNLTETGRIDASQVIVAAGALRIAENTAAKGDQAGASVVTTTTAKRTVHVDLDATYQQYAKKGRATTVELPGGQRVKGEISKVATTAKTTKGGKSTIGVDVTLTGDLKGLGSLDKAPVTVALQTERHDDVLSVPVEALIARGEGEYAVRVVTSSGSRVQPVKTGSSR